MMLYRMRICCSKCTTSIAMFWLGSDVVQRASFVVEEWKHQSIDVLDSLNRNNPHEDRRSPK